MITEPTAAHHEHLLQGPVRGRNQDGGQQEPVPKEDNPEPQAPPGEGRQQCRTHKVLKAVAVLCRQGGVVDVSDGHCYKSNYRKHQSHDAKNRARCNVQALWGVK